LDIFSLAFAPDQFRKRVRWLSDINLMQAGMFFQVGIKSVLVKV
jgi:hypothetical protein